MTTANDIIKSAMKKIGVITKSESPDTDEYADGLASLNQLLESWSNESLLVYTRTRESFTLTGGTASYTIGSGATFDTVRPISIIEAHIGDGTTDYPLAIIPDEIYEAIPVKTAQGIPDVINLNNAHPTGTLYLYPVPASAYTLDIMTEKLITSFALGSTTVTLPPGWERALVYNLAVEIAPEYGVQLDPLVLKTAMESKSLIALAVSKMRDMSSLNSWPVGYNIYTGDV